MLIAIAIAEKILELPMITLNSIWSQKSDFRTLASETTFKKSEFRNQYIFRNKNSELRIQKSEFRIQKSEISIQNSHIRIHKSEFTNQNSKKQNSEVRIQKSEFRN